MKLRNEIHKALRVQSKNVQVTIMDEGEDGLAVQIEKYRIIVSWGGGWDHVSVSLALRCPTWAEMCWIKGIFWHDHESVIQYHPAKDEYVNFHEYCLHLWKPQNCVIPTPPSVFVGIKT